MSTAPYGELFPESILTLLSPFLAAKAQGEAEAVKIEADATAYKNLKVAQNLSVMQAQWKHEEEMKRLEKWNGVQVSTQSVYVPNTYDLKSGK